jgi:Flp pilus assembly secretin CpaC
VFLSDVQVNQLMKLSHASPESTIITSPRLTLFNGQHAYVKVSTSHAYLAGYTPTTKGDGEIRYEPVVKSVDPGVTMDVTATVSADRGAVTVALHPKVSTFLGFTRVPWAGNPRNVELMVQEPHVKTSELQTTVTIPDGGTVLLGGLEDPGIGGLNAGDNAPPPSTRPGAPRGLYLLITPSIIRTTTPQQKQFPLIKGENPGLNDADPRLMR